MIKNIVFDMDGTILNTIDDLSDSLNCMLTHFNYPNHNVEVVKSFVGNGILKLVERALPKDVDNAKFNSCMSYFVNYYDKNKNNKTAPYDGILLAMAELRKAGIAMSVVSNKYHAAVVELTNQLFGEYITVAIGESDKIKPKPLPDGVKLAMEMLGASVEDTVYIGDSDVDYMTAKNANLPFLGVIWGFRTKEFLQSIGVTNLVNHPSQILDFTKKL